MSEDSSRPAPGCDGGDALPELCVPRRSRIPEPWQQPIPQRTGAHRLAEDVPRVARRWDRLIRLVGEDGIRRLLRAHVAVFGLGGVGSYATEALARSAVGSMTLVDFDDVCVTNVNRQLQAFPQTVGQSKAELLAKRVSAIHPEAIVESVQAFYEPSNADRLLDPQPDFVIDAIDNVAAKLHLVQTCLERSIPVISVTGAGARWDPTQVRVADLAATRVDPLARVMRKELGRRGLDMTRPVGLPVVYSEEEVLEPAVPAWDDEVGFQCICPHKEGSPHACEKRRKIYGTAAFMTAAFGMAAASHVVQSLARCP